MVTKFYFDMMLVAENGEALGFFDGIREFNNIPTVGEKSILFDDESSRLPFELRKYVEQSQVLENFIPFEKPNSNDIVGKCLFSFFYIPSLNSKEIFIDYFEQYYGWYFWEFTNN